VTTDSAFPVFDLARFEAASPQEKRVLAEEIDTICRATGFLAVSGHGVAKATIDACWTKAEEFFSLPVARKEDAKVLHSGYPYGYLGYEVESLARSRGVAAPADCKESFSCGPQQVPEGLTDEQALNFCYAKSIWPEAPAGFSAAWLAYYAAMEDLAARIMRVFAVALRLPEDFFAPYVDTPISALRALNYPALATAPKPGQIRAGAHTDYGSLTILLPQAGSRGLEILAPDGQWVEVPPHPGTFVLNIGDLMARWTNDRWVSTLHRVVIPADGGAQRRQSFAFFHQPNWDAEITAIDACLAPGETAKYSPVRSGPYLMSKFQSTTSY
jgi:isopenicillin N synthase-like dioxygenase